MNHKELTHWIVRCREPSLMGAIKHTYIRQYQETLESRIISETSGDYQSLLIAIVGRGKSVSRVIANPHLLPQKAKHISKSQHSLIENGNTINLNPKVLIESKSLCSSFGNLDSERPSSQSGLKEAASLSQISYTKTNRPSTLTIHQYETNNRDIYESNIAKLAISTLYNGAIFHHGQKLVSQNTGYYLILQRE